MRSRRTGHEVVFASSGQDYRGGQRGGSRLLRELRGLWALLWAALGAGRVDAVVSATSPPMLVVVAAVVAKLRRARHYHWLFDMYPELAIALGEIPDGALARLFCRRPRWAYRRADCRGGPRRRHGRPPESMRRNRPDHPPLGPRLPAKSPCLLFLAFLPDSHPPTSGSTPATWAAPTNGGPCWTPSASSRPPAPRGASSSRAAAPHGPLAQEYAGQLGLTRCDWRPYVPEEQLPASLLAADVLIVTQKPETCGLLWPSKLALVTALPRPILWVGPTDRAIARDLARCRRPASSRPAMPPALRNG